MGRASFGLMAAAVLATPLYAAPAAAFQIYTVRADWEAALAGALIVSDDFANEIPNATSITFDSGVVSTGSPATAVVRNNVDPGLSQYTGVLDAGTGPDDYFNTITWTFPVPVIGFGGVWDSPASSKGLTITGNFDGLGDQTISLHTEMAGAVTGFLGIVGDAPFSVVTLSEEGLALSNLEYEAFDLLDLSFAAAPTAVREPATLALLGAGLAGLGLLRRRR